MVAPTEQRGGRRSRSTEAPQDGTSTRERILDVALDLFVEQGYDKTSLREIAEKMGFTKAALYYHFASKDDILLALHMRLHALGTTAIRMLGEVPAEPAAWSTLLQSMIHELIDQRQLIVLHERNAAALQALDEGKHHDSEHDDLQMALRRTLSDQKLSPRDRVRLSAALGAIFAGLALSSSTFDDIPADEFAAYLRQIVEDILGPS
jgi:AcrR family transcriptional regulator